MSGSDSEGGPAEAGGYPAQPHAASAALGRLIQIWSGALGVEAGRIAAGDDFFVLGGDSLKAVQVVSRVNREYGLDLEMLDLFRSADLARFGALVDAKIQQRELGRSSPRIARVDRNGPLIASGAQKGLWFLEQLSHVEADAYSSVFALWLRGCLDVQALRRSLATIVRRHECLRTAVYMDDAGNVLQRIHPEREIELPVIPVSESQAEETLHRLCAERFDISRMPLLRASLLVLGAQHHVLAIRVHDIAFDGWSNRVLAGELNVLYRAYCHGEPDPLASLPVQYADYAHWKSQRVNAEELARQLGYWQVQLAGAHEVRGLPADFPSGALPSFRGASLQHSIPASCVRELGVLSRATGTTLFETLVAVFNILLWRYSGNCDLLVGTLTFDRAMPELQDLIGAFVQTTALRTRLEPRRTFRELLREVSRTARAAYDHQDVSYEQVVQAVSKRRGRGRQAPLFQAMFAMQNLPREPFALWNLQVPRVDFLTKRARFDLLLRTTELADGLVASLEYNADRFAAKTMQRLLQFFEVIVRNVLGQPDSSLEELPRWEALPE